MRHFGPKIFALLLLLLSCPAARAQPVPAEVEVLVYGGTPGGIAAAVAAGKSGKTVLLVEPYRWVGGLMTNGLTHTDFHAFEALTGTYLDFTRRATAHYATRYGPDSPQVKDCFRGTQTEPHVNRAVFERMLGEVLTIRVVTGWSLDTVVKRTGEPQTVLAGAEFVRTWPATNDTTTRLAVRAKVFIDGSYEGDLMAAAGVPFAVGREGRDQYGESLAPDKADHQVQGYNFRFTMTKDPARRVEVKPPAGYRRQEFLPVLEVLNAGKIKSVFVGSSGGIYKAHDLPPLPNATHDVNDVSRGLVRLSLPGVNYEWPNGDRATRQRIFDEHVRHNVGLLYFLQNDEAVPAKFRDDARQWGWSKDEYQENDHLPEQLYVREARRMIGSYVYTERDTEHAPDDARAVLHADSVAMCDYTHNCHGTAHDGPRFAGAHTGEFYKAVSPYMIPYGVITPKGVTNLLVPVAVSASHVGFCALRLEPCWMSLGQAAGHAANLAIEGNTAVQAVSVARLQQRLWADGSATIYTSDVPPGAADFAAVQWWGTLGGLHGLAPMPAKPGQRGKNITGQYFETYPGHAVELDKPLDDALRAKWLALAAKSGVDGAKLRDAKTRGDWIRACRAAHTAGGR